MFLRAFTTGAHDPTLRPTATEWRRALLGIQVTSCLRGVHQIPTTAGGCPWCVIDDERAVRKQLVHRPGSTPGTPGDRRPAAVGNSLAAVQGWLPPGDAKLRAGGVFSRRRDVILLALLPLSLLGLLFVGLFALAVACKPATAPPSIKLLATALPSATPPNDAVECTNPGYPQRYSHLATGTEATPCQFAESVRSAVTATHHQFPLTVLARSTWNDQSESMSCTLERVVTCRGGNKIV